MFIYSPRISCTNWICPCGRRGSKILFLDLLDFKPHNIRVTSELSLLSPNMREESKVRSHIWHDDASQPDCLHPLFQDMVLLESFAGWNCWKG